MAAALGKRPLSETKIARPARRFGVAGINVLRRQKSSYASPCVAAAASSVAVVPVQAYRVWHARM